MSAASFFHSRLTTIISIALVLFLMGLIMLMGLLGNKLSVYVKENISFSIVLKDNQKEADIMKMQKRLDSLPYIKSTEYISKEQAAKELEEELGESPEAFLGFNPLQASIEVKLHADYANPDSISATVSKLRSNHDVVDVIYSKDLVQSVNKNIRKISIILLIIAALFTYISFALINNTVRLTIFSKRFLINTMKLVGASWNFIRRPFMAQSFVLGVASAILADCILFGGIYWLYVFEPQIANIIDLTAVALVFVAVLFFGIVITAACTLVSINRYLRMKSNDLYYL